MASQFLATLCARSMPPSQRSVKPDQPGSEGEKRPEGYPGPGRQRSRAPAPDQDGDDGRGARPQQHAGQSLGAEPGTGGGQELGIAQAETRHAAQPVVGKADAGHKGKAEEGG